MSDHLDFETEPPMVFGRAQKRGSDGKFYFEVDEFRSEASGYLSTASAAKTGQTGLAVATGKYFHLRYLSVSHGSGAYNVFLKNPSGVTKFRTRVTSGVNAEHSGIEGIVFNGSVTVQVSTFVAAFNAGIVIGGILDSNPLR
jgi:hypothetical protein